MKIKRCPNCKSRNIQDFMGFKLGIQYKCIDCDYIGPLIIEEEIKSDK